jgi:hypothetical protein
MTKRIQGMACDIDNFCTEACTQFGIRIKGNVCNAMCFNVGMFCVKLERPCIKLWSLACYISIYFN